jgi:hypothetical protein
MTDRDQNAGRQPADADRHDAPEPERPVPQEERRRQPGGPEDKPSQAEGERGG